jgi:putative transposase
MRKFTSQGQAQGFLSCYGVANNLFWLGRHLMKASNYRVFVDLAFVEWGRASCVQNLALLVKLPFYSSDLGNLTVPP